MVSVLKKGNFSTPFLLSPCQKSTPNIIFLVICRIFFSLNRGKEVYIGIYINAYIYINIYMNLSAEIAG